jgi:gliding motility-associated-like protein
MKRLFSVILISLMVSQSALGDHFMGCDMYFKPAANPTPYGNYSFYLNFYWNGNLYDSTHYANTPQAENLAIFRKRDNKLMKNYELVVSGTGYDPVIFQNKKCAKQFGLNMYVSKYKYDHLLDINEYDDPQGYYVVFDRCCRATTLTNIDVSNINILSMVVIMDLPPLKKYPNYHSPQFIIPNGDFLCVGKPFQLNMGATDDDGDELRYSIVEPLAGYTAVGIPGQIPVTQNIARASFPVVKYATGFSGANLIPGSPSLKIDNKGMISVTPTQQGDFVFGILVEEYRGGVKIGSNRRDYMLSVKDCNPSSPTDPTILYKNSPAPPIVQICNGGNIDLSVDTTSFTDYNLQWQKNLNNIPKATRGKITVSDSGTYTVIKTWKDVCAVETKSNNSVSFKIVNGLNPIKIKADKNTACEGKAINLSLDDPMQAVDWYLETASLGTSKTLIAKKSGKYFGKLNLSGCPSKEDNLTLNFSPIPILPVPDKSEYLICSGDKVELKTVSDGNYRYQWMKGATILSGSNYAYDANSVGDYSVKVIDNRNSCDAISQIYAVKLKVFCGGTVTVSPTTKLLIPNIFTPNADGLNDAWQIGNLDKIGDCMVYVYNRWGELVYFAPKYQQDWNGTKDGKALPSGDYAYKIVTDNFVYQGSVLVVY